MEDIKHMEVTRCRPLSSQKVEAGKAGTRKADGDLDLLFLVISTIHMVH